MHPSVHALKTAIREFIDASNTAGQPYVWAKTADSAAVGASTGAGIGTRNEPDSGMILWATR